MSLKELQEDFNKIIKPQLEEILRLLKNPPANDNIEAAAAKIITELRSVIQDCPCHKILPTIGEEIIPLDEKPNPEKGTWKYSYPNFSVGNEELGTGKNPDSLTWPFGVGKEKST